MSRYFYSALGHCLRTPADDFLCCRLTSRGWYIIENGVGYSADMYAALA